MFRFSLIVNGSACSTFYAASKQSCLDIDAINADFNAL